MKLRRQFWLGILAGLSVGSVLRCFSTGGFGQDSIKRMYSGVNRVSWDLEGQGLPLLTGRPVARGPMACRGLPSTERSD